MTKNEFGKKLKKIEELVNQIEDIIGEISDEVDLTGCDEMIDYLISSIHGLIPDETGYTSSTVNAIMDNYGDFITDCDNRRLAYAIEDSNPETIERFLGYKPEPDCDLETAINETLAQMPEEEINKFRTELFKTETYSNETTDRMVAYDIDWDTDGEDVDLPNEILLPSGMTDEDEISDYISDETGFCHNGFKLAESLKERIEMLKNFVAADAELELDYDVEKDLWYVMNYFIGYAENIIEPNGKLMTAFEHVPYEDIIEALDKTDVGYVGR